MSTSAPYALSTKPLPLHSLCYLGISLMAPGRRSQADYLTHKGREYLLVCDLFSKYPFIYKVSTKSVQSLCVHLYELISQYGPLSLLFMDNDPQFASDELAQFLQYHHIDHITSSPHFPWSNGLIEHHIHTIKTILSTSQDSGKTLKTYC